MAARFIISAARPEQFPPEADAEVAFLGRSNVGKSSLLNALVSAGKVAHVSSRPGCTQEINFYQVDGGYRFVDLPGYGFAKVPERVRLHWLELMQHYFNVRESLVGLMLIVDSRRGLGAQDAAMLEWVLARDRSAHVLLTKADKLNRRDSQRVLRETIEACADTAVTAQLFSAHAKQGFEHAREVMDRWLSAAS